MPLLIMWMFSWVYTYTETYQILYFKYLQFIVYHVYFDQAALKNEMRT